MLIYVTLLELALRPRWAVFNRFIESPRISYPIDSFDYLLIKTLLSIVIRVSHR
jgi:hypothetical protein